jgi:hypothetical protein
MIVGTCRHERVREFAEWGFWHRHSMHCQVLFTSGHLAVYTFRKQRVACFPQICSLASTETYQYACEEPATPCSEQINCEACFSTPTVLSWQNTALVETGV